MACYCHHNHIKKRFRRVNDTIKPSRAKTLDHALLITGPFLIVTIPVWGLQHGYLVKKRKRLLQQAILQEFNAQYPDLLMRYNTNPESCLTIERRTNGVVPPMPQQHTELTSERVVMVEPLQSRLYYSSTQRSPPNNKEVDVPLVHASHSTDDLPQLS